MTSREVGEWLAFNELEPFGDLRDDLRAGTIAATIANVKGRKDSKVFKPADFFAELAPPEALAAKDKYLGGISVAAAMAATIASGGKVIRRSEMKQ